MKTILPLTLVLSLLLACSCEKTNKAGSCPETANLCVRIGETVYSGSAIWYRIPNQQRFRILWENGAGPTYQNIEIDVYTADTLLQAGDYLINDSRQSGTAAFQWFDSGVAWYGQSGQLRLESISNALLTGDFSVVVAKDGTGETVNFQEGKLQSVPKQ